jgi:peptidoglycan/LPS O-acetylase OafA/YrhL
LANNFDRHNITTTFWVVLAGLIAYAAIGKLGLYLLQVSWAGYALHSTDKSYSTGMLLARLLVGVLASVAAGITVAKVTNSQRKSAWIVGVIVLCGASYIHFMTKTWTDYPLWYHLAYVLPIVPVIALSRLFVK